MVRNWFESYLRDRSQCVKFGGCTSEIIKPSSGVPQGSILGPLLFIIFIDDLADCLHSKNLGYADDFKLFRQIRSLDDCIALQSDLISLNDWCIRNDMDLNIAKCSIITFTRKKKVFTFEYGIDGQILKRVVEVKDLGILIDSKLTFDKHVNYVFRRCNKLLGFIFRACRCRRFKSKSSLMFLYNSFIRSLCEYSSVIWNPHYKIYQDKIERIQRKYTRLLYYKFGLRKPEYETRLSYLRMQKLSLRRTIIDELYLFKIINGHVFTDLCVNIKFYADPYQTRSAPTFDLPNRNTNIHTIQMPVISYAALTQQPDQSCKYCQSVTFEDV